MGDILRVENLAKRFVKKSLFGAGSAVRAVDGVSFSVTEGEVFVLAGESGSGKSTIARLILGAERPDSGSVFLDGGLVGHDASSLRRIRTQCQMVHQNPYDSVNPRMRVSDIVAEPLGIHGYGGRYKSDRVAEALAEVRLEPGEIMPKHPHMLSGGQRQRVVLARALALKPRIIIADEPVSMLDVSVRAEMLDLMSELRKRHGISFVYITHDLATARHFGDRIAILYMGRIVETGGIDDVLLRPRHPYTQALIDAVPEPAAENLHRGRTIRITERRDVDPYSGCRFRARCPYAIDRCGTEPELECRDGRQVACFVDTDGRGQRVIGGQV